MTAWAVRLVNALAREGRACGLVVHDEPPGQRAIAVPIDPRVEVFDARCLPPLDACEGDLESFLPVYRVALGVLAVRGGGPVVCCPNLLGDSYGLCAALSQATPDLVRTIAVHHADLPYNDLLCMHYAAHLSAFVSRSPTGCGGSCPGAGAMSTASPTASSCPSGSDRASRSRGDRSGCSTPGASTTSRNASVASSS